MNSQFSFIALVIKNLIMVYVQYIYEGNLKNENPYL